MLSYQIPMREPIIMVMVDIDINCETNDQQDRQRNDTGIRYSNTTTEMIKSCIQKSDDLKLTVELVPPGCHRRNAAKEAILHFHNALAGTSDDFLPSLWDHLFAQTRISLNLLCQSNATPTVSAYAHLNGPFNYNKMPLAPMGCEAQIHEKTVK
ncbi:hypothetical protein ACHAW6_010989 [Cyclotella cf. meneghiniana]